jgi:hypothetical protein
MLKPLNNPETKLRELHKSIGVFFNNLELSDSLESIPFPEWFDEAFIKTDLKKKLGNVFNEYKAISDKSIRDRILNAYTLLNQVKELCIDLPFKNFDEKENLKAITGDSKNEFWLHIEDLFETLYNNYLEYHEFEKHSEINTTVKEYIDDFNKLNKITICPFCGIEGITRTAGQQRTALDHWLCKSKFPFSSVNFDNLVPLGNYCNGKGVKGSRNVLIDEHQKRVTSLYPYINHQSFKLKFSFLSEPKRIEDYNSNNWSLDILPNDPKENGLFNSWMSIFNIKQRFNSYLENTVFIHWEDNYIEFIEQSQHLTFANNLDDFRNTLQEFKNTFPRNKRDGAILYSAFLEYLLCEATEEYLKSLMINLSS